MKTKVSEKGKAFIKKEEGCKLTAYKDAGRYSIGYGHYGATEGQTITKEHAERLFEEDIKIVEDYIHRIPGGSELPQNIFDALASLKYNVSGFGNGLKDAIKSGIPEHIANWLMKYDKSQGQFKQFLKDRRTREAAMILGPGFTEKKDNGLWILVPVSLFLSLWSMRE